MTRRKKGSPKGISGDLFPRIWAVWGLLTFIITFLLIFFPSMICYLMPERKGQSYFIRVSKIWMNIWLFLIRCPVKVSGTENFKTGKVYIVVFNHNTLLDVPLSCPYVPGPNKTIAKSSFTKVPLFGLFYKRGAVLVNRKDPASRRKSYELMKQVLSKGMHMCIYPEGTRNRTEQPLKSFSDGAFRLSVETNTAIIPCILTGTKRAMPVDRSWYLLPTHLNMNFLEPILPNNMSFSELKEKTFTLMKTFYVSHAQAEM